jgi:hypothetical protein
MNQGDEDIAHFVDFFNILIFFLKKRHSINSTGSVYPHTGTVRRCGYAKCEATGHNVLCLDLAP